MFGVRFVLLSIRCIPMYKSTAFPQHSRLETGIVTSQVHASAGIPHKLPVGGTVVVGITGAAGRWAWHGRMHLAEICN